MKKININKKSIMLIAIILLLIIILVFSLKFIIKDDNSQIDYNTKMDIIGFSDFYTSDSDKITKLEALKIIIAVNHNNNKIDDIYFSPDEQDENEKWINYAYFSQIVPLSYLDNPSENIKLIDVLEILGKSKEKILNKELNTIDNIALADFDSYYENSKNYIKDMLANNILDNVNENLNGNEEITKDKFNELIVKYMFKYSTLTSDNENINYSNSLNLNENYPFTIENLEEKSYNTKYIIEDKNNFNTPNEVYKKYKRIDYNDELVYKYCENILNIDYEIIDSSNLYNELLTTSDYTSEEVNKYIEYIKENKIKISGNANIVKPIIYFDGTSYRLRIQINYEIINSDTNKNIFIFNNTKSTKKYKNKDSVIIDFEVELDENGNVISIK